jgi:hypothetical protein
LNNRTVTAEGTVGPAEGTRRAPPEAGPPIRSAPPEAAEVRRGQAEARPGPRAFHPQKPRQMIEIDTTDGHAGNSVSYGTRLTIGPLSDQPDAKCGAPPPYTSPGIGRSWKKDLVNGIGDACGCGGCGGYIWTRGLEQQTGVPKRPGTHRYALLQPLPEAGLLPFLPQGLRFFVRLASLQRHPIRVSISPSSTGRKPAG